MAGIIRDIVDHYLYTPFDDKTVARLEEEIGRVFPGEVTVSIKDDRTISLCPKTEADATLLALMW